MAPDPITAALDQLAAHREHITALDTREASHFAEVNEQLTQITSMITTLGRALVDNTAALARLDALGRQPRPGRQPGRRSEPAGRRRPPGRARRPGDHPHPELRPPHYPPGPPRRAWPPGRGGELT